MLSIIELTKELKNIDIDQISNPREVLKEIVAKISEIKIDYNNLSNDDVFYLFKTQSYNDFKSLYTSSYNIARKFIYIDKMFRNRDISTNKDISTNTNTDIIDHKEKIELLLSNGYYFLEKHHPIHILLSQELTPFIESSIKIVVDYYNKNSLSFYRLKSELSEKSDVYDYNKKTEEFLYKYINESKSFSI